MLKEWYNNEFLTLMLSDLDVMLLCLHLTLNQLSIGSRALLGNEQAARCSIETSVV
jgi:hypothetical protein